MSDTDPTISEAKANYYTNVGYDGPDGSVAMATALIHACRVLLVLLNKRVSHGGRAEEAEIDPTVIERQIASAQRWIYSRNARTNGQVVRVFRREPYY